MVSLEESCVVSCDSGVHSLELELEPFLFGRLKPGSFFRLVREGGLGGGIGLGRFAGFGATAGFAEDFGRGGGIGLGDVGLSCMLDTACCFATGGLKALDFSLSSTGGGETERRAERGSEDALAFLLLSADTKLERFPEDFEPPSGEHDCAFNVLIVGGESMAMGEFKASS